MIDRRAQALADRRRIRRYAVPRWMIEQATERRAAGDWEGACRAARVRVEIDLDALPDPQVRAAVEDDLRHFAPDLLRWHLPRYLRGRTTLEPLEAIVLARYGEGAALHILTPRLVDGPQDLTLRLGELEQSDEESLFRTHTERDWTHARHLWDVRHSAELLERSGGDGRLPFFHADGTPLARDELGDPGTGLAGLFERVTLLQDRGEHVAAFDAAGIDLDPAMEDIPSYYGVDKHALLSAPAPVRLLPELERFGAGRYIVGFDHPVWLLLELRPEGHERPRARLLEQRRSKEAGSLLWVPEVFRSRLPDLDLLRAGHLTPDELHPLVRSALFPARPPATGPVGPPDPQPSAPVRVRCRGEWHTVQIRDGGLQTEHGAQEQEREAALQAFGGQVTGCFAVRHHWATAEGRLPRALRAQRQELFLRVQHGDAPGVLRMLDAGADPAVRDGRKRTLLHYLHMLDHTELLPRLLDAGLDLEAGDQNGRTPLHMAVGDHGTVALIRDLLDAGARIDVADEMGWGLHDLIQRTKRTDLAWLQERLEKEHPGIGGGWWDPEEYY